MDYLEELRQAIRATHGCDSKHAATTPVKEVFQGRAAWEGEVETFDLIGHPKAKRAYAWGYPDEKRAGRLTIVSVLEIPPVTSPETAVKAAIVSAARVVRN